MNKKILTAIVAAAMALSFVLTGCGEKETGKAEHQHEHAQTTEAAKPAETKAPEAKAETKTTEAAKPAEGQQAATGESGFNEIPIGETIEGPYQVSAVYFQAVDMIPEGRQLSAKESDMHLEADIHMTPEAAKKYGFGDGEEVWPAYLQVSYRVLTPDGKEITNGSMQPMNADDGAHYGINVKKGAIPVGKYKLEISIQPSQDYLLHVDDETGVPAIKEGGKEAAAKYYEKHTVTFDWNYDASQLSEK